jgi:hypothetical protein
VRSGGMVESTKAAVSSAKRIFARRFFYALLLGEPYTRSVIRATTGQAGSFFKHLLTIPGFGTVDFCSYYDVGQMVVTHILI